MKTIVCFVIEVIFLMAMVCSAKNAIEVWHWGRVLIFAIALNCYIEMVILRAKD